MDQQEITDVVNCIGDFIHEGNIQIGRRTEGVRCYLEYLQLNSTDVSEKVAKMVKTNVRNVEEASSKEWSCFAPKCKQPEQNK